MPENPKLLSTSQPDLFFEDSAVGRLKKQIWEASDEEVDQMLAEYGVPSPPEWCKPGSYVQTTVRHELEQRRKKNDVVLVPIGCTENHGRHTVSAMDTLFVTGICEGVRRYTEKKGYPVNLALPPLFYGCHPYHHVGMPGTIIIREDVAREFLIDVMLGLYNDGFQKIILINNHGHLWVLEAALQQFCKRFQLPGFFRVMDWHRAVREFFRTKEFGGKFDTPFIHADEAETSLGLLMFPDMVDMSQAVDTESVMLMPGGHMDTAVDSYRRPSRWSECEGHAAIEIKGTPEGVVGKPTLGDPEKAKRPVLAIMKYLTLLIDETLEAFPPGTVPPTDKLSLRDPAELEAYLKEPLSEGWKSVYGLPQVGPF